MMQLWRSLFPRACPGCGQPLGAAAGLCPQCRAELRPRVERYSVLSPQPTPHLVSLGRYTGTVRRCVRELKYGQARELAGVLGQHLAEAVPRTWALDQVVAVPMHTQRQRERGYNQAEVLAQALAQALDLPYAPALERTRATRQQARLSAAERQHNLDGAFRVRPERLYGDCVLLVDDVLTTGTTLALCRDALHGAGVGQVYYAVVAH